LRFGKGEELMRRRSGREMGRRGRGNDKCYRATQGSDGDTGRIKEGREILRK